ncbi:hypothetical protein [Paucibacter sp. Y2R2-4]|uniref:hypothetical protein n=1 Tax=Paucibacter sp. Y2R2-4 TaxID=2893553 RepID=UPI0021E4557D|nr:hypothetical protein [Paucibacter sp. Y2R2-4]MCV2351265.1 hypothetical protein [Paucibacter sp. Y2R2-4]
MLRALVLLLLLLNGLFFSWTQGWLDGVIGIKAGGTHEPERLNQQVNPESIKLLEPQAAAALQTRVCLESGLLGSEAALNEAQAALQGAGFSAADWQVQHSEQAGVWAVASIRLPTKDFQARKEETYKKLKISFEYLSGMPEEMPTLLLSRHDSEKAANAALESLSQRALKGLRVLQLQTPSKRYKLVMPQLDGLQQGRVANLKDGAAVAGGFKACPVQPAAAAASTAASAASAPLTASSAAATGPKP